MPPNIAPFLQGISDTVSSLHSVQVIATGRAVASRQMLRRRFGPGRWRKMKGIATVELDGGTMVKAEVHWYEAHGLGRFMVKVKRVLN